MICRVLLATALCLMAVVDARGQSKNEATSETKRTVEAKSQTGDVPASQAEFWYVTYLDDAIGLTEKQKETMRGIIRERNKSMWDFQVRNAQSLKAAGEAVVAAYRSMERDAIARAQKEYQELQAPLHQIMKRGHDKLMQVLTTDQKSRLADFQITKAIEAMATPVKLSNDQIKRVRTIWPKADDLEAGPAACDEAVQQVLTTEQKITIAKYRAMEFVKAAFGAAKLSDDQLKQAELIVTELTKDLSVKPEDLHKTLTTKVDAILGPEQKEAMKKPWIGSGGNPAGWGQPNVSPGNQGKASKVTDKR